MNRKFNDIIIETSGVRTIEGGGTNASNAGQALQNLFGVSLSGNQTISGLKNFVFRPTVNETGALLSGESYTKTETNTLLSNANSHVIYVDKYKQTALGIARDGSRAHPFISVRDAFAAIGNAANSTEFNDINLRYWTIKVAAGSYDETAGGDLQVPKRFFVKLDLSDGASIIGNLVRDISGLVASLGDNPVFLIEGSSNRPSYETAGTVQRTQIGVLGNISMVNNNGSINALHLFAAVVRKVEYSGTDGIGHFFANQNSTWDTLFSPTKQVTFYCAGTRNSTSVASAGNVIGNIYINPVYDTSWISNKSVFPTNQVFFRFDEGVAPPTYIERRATSFTRSSNRATVTLAENHGLSLSPAIVSDGYVPEQYIIINGVSENTSFNTPLYGAKVISYPSANTVTYESSGVDVTTPVTAANSKLIRGTFFGNASLAGFNQMGANGRASENAAMTFPNFANATELGQDSAFLLGFAKGVSFSNPLTSWPASTTLPKNTILILDDQFQYRTTTGVGRTSTVQPVFPTTIGATVQDGSVTWICEENALDRNLPRKFNVQSKIEQLSNAKNIYLKSNISGLSSVNNVKDALEYSYLNIITGNLTISGVKSFTDNTDFKNDISVSGFYNFNTTNTGEPLDGQMSWHPDYGTVQIGMNGGQVVNPVGFKSFYRVKAASTIRKGKVVMALGGVGNSEYILAREAQNIGNSGQLIMGVSAEEITQNNYGDVVAFGAVRGVNTSGLPVDSILYYDPLSTGGLTHIAPQAPLPKVTVAINTTSSNNGIIFVRVSAGSELGGTDSNVKFNSLQDKDVVKYNAASGLWVNSQLNTGDVSGISNLQTQIDNRVTNLGGASGIQVMTTGAYNAITPISGVVYILI